MDEDIIEHLDEIDREIIRLLSQHPRAPYRELAETLEERGHEMSGEGVRYRVSRILEATSVFLLLSPAEHGWEIVRVGIEVSNAPGATETVSQQIAETEAWLVCQGFGSFDVWAVGTTKDNKRIREFLSEIRGLDCVERVHHFVETERDTMMEDYLSFE